MNILKDKEWQIINEIILVINQSTDLKVIRKDFLTLVRLLVMFDKAEFSLAADDFILNKPVTLNIEDEILEEYGKYYINTDSLSLLYDAPSSLAYIDSDISTGLFIKNNEYYNVYLKKLNTPYVSTIVLALNHQYLGSVTLFRAKTSGDFDSKDLFILEQLKDHLANRLSHLTENYYVLKLSKANYIFFEERNLTKREIEIIELILSGLSNKIISDKLYISELTVKKHITNIYCKLHIKNKIELIRILSSE